MHAARPLREQHLLLRLAEQRQVDRVVQPRGECGARGGLQQRAREAGGGGERLRREREDFCVAEHQRHHLPARAKCTCGW